jgi:hypothetical protein
MYRKYSLLGPPSSKASSPENITVTGLLNEKPGRRVAKMVDFRMFFLFISKT